MCFLRVFNSSFTEPSWISTTYAPSCKTAYSSSKVDLGSCKIPAGCCKDSCILATKIFAFLSSLSCLSFLSKLDTNYSASSNICCTSQIIKGCLQAPRFRKQMIRHFGDTTHKICFMFKSHTVASTLHGTWGLMEDISSLMRRPGYLKGMSRPLGATGGIFYTIDSRRIKELACYFTTQSLGAIVTSQKLKDISEQDPDHYLSH